MRISVIITTYNLAAMVPDAINSVLAQTVKPYEILVVDDGSTDDTAQVVSQFGGRVTYIRKENGGVANARNFGLKKATGELIAFLDADDIWLPSKLEKQVMHFQDPLVGISATDFSAEDSTGLTLTSFFASTQLLAEGFIFDNLLVENFLSPCTSLIRAECFEKLGGFDESLRTTEDRDMWLRIARRWKVRLVREVLVRTRDRVGSLSSDHQRSIPFRIRVFSKVLGLDDLTRAQARLARAQISQGYMSIAYHQLWNGSRSAAGKAAIQAIRFRPNSWKAYLLLLKTLVPKRLLANLRAKLRPRAD